LIREVVTPGSRPSLTERETDVLRLLAQGQSNKEIARGLSIGEQTVKTHVAHILSKLDMSSRTQAALYAIQTGLVSVGPPDQTAHA
jgi:DNA-binding NarL/FixJ family response regulator